MSNDQINLTSNKLGPCSCTGGNWDFDLSNLKLFDLYFSDLQLSDFELASVGKHCASALDQLGYRWRYIVASPYLRLGLCCSSAR